jgi:hypothetical protein
MASFFLVLAALSAFLIRQPAILAVKMLSWRRPRRDLPASFFWIGLYSLIGLLSTGELVLLGFSRLLLLAIPGMLVFALHLYLVSRKAERRQAGVEIAASGVLALAAPAAFWTGSGGFTAVGWILWALTWLQSAGSIVHAYMRLEQRTQKTALPVSQRLRGKNSLTRRAWIYTGVNFLVVAILSLFHAVPAWLFLPYGVQLGETLWGTFHPATGALPAAIGIRQLIISSLFTVLFILAWNTGR